MHRKHRHRHHHCHEHLSPSAAVLGITHIIINEGTQMSTVTLTATVPVTRKSGAALSVAEISKIELSRNGTIIDSVVPTGPTVSFTDKSPPDRQRHLQRRDVHHGRLRVRPVERCRCDDRRGGSRRRRHGS